MRYIIKLSYDGSAFCGWQIQPNAPTVQENLEKALSTLLRTDISVTGAGRTDTGVNAIGYIAHFDCDIPFDATLIGYKINAILPHGIHVHSIEPAAPDFHARFGASRREYTYFLHKKKDPFVEKYSLQYTFPIDVDLMNEAAKSLLGTHDFSCFEKVGADNHTSICTITEAHWETYVPTHVGIMGYASEPGDYIYFRVAADRFLRNMVRAIVGSLLEVGRGRRSIEDFRSLVLPPETGLEAPHKPNRCRAGESVPGHALFLSEINYPESR